MVAGPGGAIRKDLEGLEGLRWLDHQGGGRWKALNAGAAESLGEILMFAAPGLLLGKGTLFEAKEALVNQDLDGVAFETEGWPRGLGGAELENGILCWRRVFEDLGGFKGGLKPDLDLYRRLAAREGALVLSRPRLRFWMPPSLATRLTRPVLRLASRLGL